MLLRSVLILSGGAFCFGQSNPAFRETQDVPGLPRILLIGDSISIGYTEPVREALKDKANVLHCRFFGFQRRNNQQYGA